MSGVRVSFLFTAAGCGEYLAWVFDRIAVNDPHPFEIAAMISVLALLFNGLLLAVVANAEQVRRERAPSLLWSFEFCCKVIAAVSWCLLMPLLLLNARWSILSPTSALERFLILLAPFLLTVTSLAARRAFRGK